MTPGEYTKKKAEKAIEESKFLGDINFLFDEKEINELLATCVPLIKVPTINISSIYVDVSNNENIHGEAPFWFLFYKSCAYADCVLTYDDTTAYLDINDIHIRSFTSQKGIVKDILSEERVKSIQESINNAGVELTMWKEGTTVKAKMTNLDIVKTIINCTHHSGIGFLSAALTAGTLNSLNVELIVNQNGKTGIVIHKSLILSQMK